MAAAKKTPAKSTSKTAAKAAKVPSKAAAKAPSKTPKPQAAAKVPTKAAAKAPTKAPAKAPAKPAVKAPTKAPTKAPAKAPAREAPRPAPAKQPSKPAAKAPTKAPAKAAAVPAKPQPAAKPAPAKGGKNVAGLDAKFLKEQRELLLSDRQTYMEQAEQLKAEADLLAQEMEPGDIQFDEESGEGTSANIDRERDLALSAAARAAVEEIDRALAKIDLGTYGVCERCGQPIPKLRLKAIPHADLCVGCKAGGLSRRM